MLLHEFAAFLKSKPKDLSFHVALASDQDEDSRGPVSEPELRTGYAEIVEGQGMASCTVGKPAGTGFSCFLDGAQIARRIGFYNYTVPIVYGYIGAVIRRRGEDRRMSTLVKECAENLYFSFDHLSPSTFAASGVSARNARITGKESSSVGDAHPLKLIQAARESVNNDRSELERRLIKKWAIECGNSDEWLFWDGSITGSDDAAKHPRVVGIIKSHQTQYFSGEDQHRILSLKVGERSTVFKVRGRGRESAYSWYLRLHPFEGRDIYFGLVRVEAAARPETITNADDISRWLLAERSPLALPDGRWDRMVYPIRDCEQYLRSIFPSRVAIEAALAGV